ncbi:Arylsulfatase A [Jatrophihabitans endophyticus]|uniref:Arylsulfatase A n=1 Tax=Jatrophihabitans endophyticus TaxID=1206085 RepID=A0A1M5CSZ3_9ACTN|nr:sulfatase [Jatrophihabitans endophyticus]SHF57766.1 Arylsulfatase A [Jatrophihabitans endophyticus]
MTLRGPRRRRAVAFGLALSSLALAACTGTGAPSPRPTPSHAPYSARPNIVYVLTDDLSANLVPYMPHVRALSATGTTFDNYSVTDSLCCPSRASIFTGKYPHNSHVFTNIPPDGGMIIYNRYGGPAASYGTALQRSGYRTALLGKYLNNYMPGKKVAGLAENYRPQGWSTWGVAGNGYPEYGYKLNHDGVVRKYGHEPEDYLTRVVTKLGVGFIEQSVRDRKPFALELSTFAPHAPYTPDPQDADSFLDLKAPRVPSFDRKPAHMPRWLSLAPRSLSRKNIAEIDRSFVKRVQAVQSVDRAIGTLQAALRRTGQLRNTVFVFNSDNGYHLGEHGLREGKRTAFDTDVHVPLVVSGPGIPAGATSHAMVENIDLAPTFLDLAGVHVPATMDGHSVVPLLRGKSVPWRTRALVEHHGVGNHPGDPDTQPIGAGYPPTYDSLRGPDWTYVRYSDGEREYYDRATDPWENDNLAGSLTPARRAELNRQLTALTSCHGGAQCWAAGRPARS